MTFGKLVRWPFFAPNLHGSRPSQQNLFLSTVKTGTGAAQNIAHGLVGYQLAAGTPLQPAVPTAVLVVLTDNSGSAGVFTVTEGVHDATNVKLTVTSGAKYKVLAWL